MAYLGAIATLSPIPYWYNQNTPVTRAPWPSMSVESYPAPPIPTMIIDLETSFDDGLDSGAIMTNYGGAAEFGARVMPQWALDWRGMFPNNTVGTFTAAVTQGLAQSYNKPAIGIPVNGSIRGKTMTFDEDLNGNVVAPYKRVVLYYRPTGQKIFETQSDGAGMYEFTGLEPATGKYLVTGLYDDGTTYDAVSHDKISAGT